MIVQSSPTSAKCLCLTCAHPTSNRRRSHLGLVPKEQRTYHLAKRYGLSAVFALPSPDFQGKVIALSYFRQCVDIAMARSFTKVAQGCYHNNVILKHVLHDSVHDGPG